jgi:hypothetical protein
MTNDLVKRLRIIGAWKTPGGPLPSEEMIKPHLTCEEAASRIEELEAALRTIDNAIPKNDPILPAICLIAGDIAEGALNGTWPAFGVIPRAALGEKKDDN